MSGKILIVDDDPSILEILKLIINKLGYEPIDFNNGLKAIEYILANRNNSDIKLILMDIMMENQDGIETLKEIYHIKPNIPSIIFTAYADWDIVNRNHEFIKDIPILQKPLDAEKLIRMLEIILQKPEEKIMEGS